MLPPDLFNFLTRKPEIVLRGFVTQLIFAVLVLFGALPLASAASMDSCEFIFQASSLTLKPIKMLSDFKGEDTAGWTSYLSPAELTPYKAVVRNGKIGRWTNGIFDELGAAGGPQISRNFFIVSPAGDLYVGPPDGSNSHVRHSSFLRGKSVGFAGHISISDGDIQELDVFSGHYQPHVTALIKLLDGLAAEKIPVDKINVEVHLDSEQKWSAETVRKLRKYAPAYAFIYELKIDKSYRYNRDAEIVERYRKSVHDEIRKNGTSKTLAAIFRALPEIDDSEWGGFVADLISIPEIFDAKFIKASFQPLMTDEFGSSSRKYEILWEQLMKMALQNFKAKENYSSLSQSQGFQEALRELRQIAEQSQKMVSLVVYLRTLESNPVSQR